jgi:hypothetical protein
MLYLMIMEAGKEKWKCWHQANRMVDDAVTSAHALCGGKMNIF